MPEMGAVRIAKRDAPAVEDERGHSEYVLVARMTGDVDDAHGKGRIIGLDLLGQR